MRTVKQAITKALADDDAVSALVPTERIYAVERSTLPTLPSIELIALSSEPQESGPMVRHSMSCEITVSHQTEDGADELLDGIVRAVRQRIGAAEHQIAPIALASGENALCVLHGTRWSVSVSAASSVMRGAAISLSVEVSE